MCSCSSRWYTQVCDVKIHHTSATWYCCIFEKSQYKGNAEKLLATFFHVCISSFGVCGSPLPANINAKARQIILSFYIPFALFYAHSFIHWAHLTFAHSCPTLFHFRPLTRKTRWRANVATTTTKTNGIIFNVIFSFRQQFTCLHQQKFNEEKETQTHKKENGIKIETIQSGLYVGWNGYYVGLSHVIFARSLLHITCMLSKHRFFLFSFANYTEKRNWHIDIWKNAILGMGIKHRQRRSVE